MSAAEAPIVSATVPRLFPGETIVCLGTGPSLCQEDIDACRGRARVVAVKNAIDRCSWADVLYGAGGDGKGRPGPWWQQNGPRLTSFAGLRFTLDPAAAPWASVLGMSPTMGIETNPAMLAVGHFTGNNSGAQAIGLATHLGAAKIVLLGYDAQPDSQGNDHWFGAHPWDGYRLQYGAWPDVFASIAAALTVLGVEIINASRVSALTCFPRATIAEALA